MADRDPKTGRFLPGNKASPGRKPRATEAEYLAAMSAAVSIEDWEKATGKMLKLALAGDVQAYRVILPYFAGTPIQRLQLSTAEAQILADVLDALRVRGIGASDVFNALLASIAEDKADAT